MKSADIDAWIAGDPDPFTQRELRELADADPEAALARVQEKLTFGTAGLRGLVGAGPGRMNRATILRSTRGLVDYLLAQEPDAAERGICIGYDARPDSQRFAADVAGVVAAAGVVAHVFETYAPTPLVAFALRHVGAAAGVVVTASHNPPEYNGYKVFWGNGAQIVPPTTRGSPPPSTRRGRRIRSRASRARKPAPPTGTWSWASQRSARTCRRSEAS